MAATSRTTRSQLLPDASRVRCAVVVSQYHSDITENLLSAATSLFTSAGGARKNLLIIHAPGAFELTPICRCIAYGQAAWGRPDVLVALGCIITGQTTHDQYIAHSVTQGLTAITLATGVPICFGVLTCQTLAQAKARSSHSTARRSSNKGAEAMSAALGIASTLRALRRRKASDQ